MTGAASQTSFAQLQSRILDYGARVGQLRSPDQALDELHGIISSPSLPLSVFGAVRLPAKPSGWDMIQLGESIFLHKDIPADLWKEYQHFARGKARPLLFLAQTAMGSYTWTDVRRMLAPIGSELSIFELGLKYGMRDGLTCPVGGRWAVVFWSRKELSNTVLTQRQRIMIFAAASYLGLRLEQLAGPTGHARLTPRELAVLRLASTGGQSRDIAEALGLGEETVRSHLKKAEAKLGVRNRTHAVAEALRQKLIP